MQFSNHGPLEPHGFARNRIWSIDADPPPFPTSSSSKAFIDLILKPSEEDLKIWPHRYGLGPLLSYAFVGRINVLSAYFFNFLRMNHDQNSYFEWVSKSVEEFYRIFI